MMGRQTLLRLERVCRKACLGCLLVLEFAACRAGGIVQYSDAEVSRYRSRFTALCSYRHFFRGYDVNGHTVEACPEVISRESEWFGLSGPVSEVVAGTATYRFDREGHLQHISDTLYWPGEEMDVERKGATLRFSIGDSICEMGLDEAHRIRTWTKRCARNCSIGLANVASGKESAYVYPVGTLREQATYEYLPGPELVIHQEEFNVIGATATRPGASYRLKVESFSRGAEGQLHMLVGDRIGPPGSRIYENRAAWFLAQTGHRRTEPRGQQSAEVHLALDQYGNWIERRVGEKEAYTVRRKISYYRNQAE